MVPGQMRLEANTMVEGQKSSYIADSLSNLHFKSIFPGVGHGS